MGVDLELKASRSITVDKTGVKESQSYFLQVISFKSEECIRIANSEDPYKEYCALCRSMYSDLTEPVFVWEVGELTPEIEQRKFDAFLGKHKPEDIAYYISRADEIVEYLDMEIKKALDAGYELEWSAW